MAVGGLGLRELMLVPGVEGVGGLKRELRGLMLLPGLRSRWFPRRLLPVGPYL